MKNILLAIAFVGFMTSSYATTTIVSSSENSISCEGNKCNKKDCKHKSKECKKKDTKKSCCQKEKKECVKKEGTDKK